jgi:hypothetical protein
LTPTLCCASAGMVTAKLRSTNARERIRGNVRIDAS